MDDRALAAFVCDRTPDELLLLRRLVEDRLRQLAGARREPRTRTTPAMILARATGRGGRLRLSERDGKRLANLLGSAANGCA